MAKPKRRPNPGPKRPLCGPYSVGRKASETSPTCEHRLSKAQADAANANDFDLLAATLKSPRPRRGLRSPIGTRRARRGPATWLKMWSDT